jgi:hypothetical protein
MESRGDPHVFQVNVKVEDSCPNCGRPGEFVELGSLKVSD